MMVIGYALIFSSLLSVSNLLLRKKRSAIERYRERSFGLLSSKLENHYIFLSTPFFSTVCKTLALVVVMCSFFLEPIAIVGLFSAFFVLPMYLLHHLERNRRNQFVRQFHAWLPTFSSMLKSGNSFEKALEISSKTSTPPLSQEFEFILKQAQVGISLEESLEDLRRRFPDRDVELCTKTIQLSLRTGASLSGILDTSIELIQKRRKLMDKLDSLTLQSKMQGYIGMVIPVFIFTAVRIFDPDYLAPFTNSALGTQLLLFSAILLLAGCLWIRRLSRIQALW